MDRELAQAVHEIATAMTPKHFCLFSHTGLCLSATEWAAWAGVLGAMLAIFISAAMLHWRQTLHERSLHQGIAAEKLEALRRVMRALSDAKAGIQFAVNDLTDGKPLTRQRTAPMDIHWQVARELTAEALPDRSLYGTLRKAQFALDELYAAVKRREAALSAGESVGRSYKDEMESSAEMLFLVQHQQLERQLQIYAAAVKAQKRTSDVALYRS